MYIFSEKEYNGFMNINKNKKTKKQLNSFSKYNLGNYNLCGDNLGNIAKLLNVKIVKSSKITDFKKSGFLQKAILNPISEDVFSEIQNDLVDADNFICIENCVTNNPPKRKIETAIASNHAQKKASENGLITLPEKVFKFYGVNKEQDKQTLENLLEYLKEKHNYL
jgi:hypothetical protein